jgi:hypothetical protein
MMMDLDENKSPEDHMAEILIESESTKLGSCTLMKVTAENDTFYLETTCKDPTLAHDEEELQEIQGRTVNQAMYLVVRSLKDE